MSLHILCIVPYGQMSKQIKEVSVKYDDVNVDIIEAFYMESEELPEFIYKNHFDAIISRGGTAYYLSKKVKIPVFEIPVSAYDLLRALSQARQLSKNIALVSYKQICDNAKYLSVFLGWELAVFPFNNSAEIEETIKHCTSQGYNFIIGGQATAAYADSYGACFLPISTGRESIEEAFRNATLFFKYSNQLEEKSKAFQSILDHLPSSVFVSSYDGTQLYSNKAAYSLINSDINTSKIIDDEISNLDAHTDIHVVKKLGSAFYNINGTTFELEKNNKYSRRYVFQINYRSPVYKKYSPVSISTIKEIRDNLLSEPCIEPYFGPFNNLIEAACASEQTILIQGETGSLKNVLAQQIYLNYSKKAKSLVTIDCSMLNAYAWNDILNNPSHIIHGVGHVLFFDKLENCDVSILKLLHSYAVASNLFNRHKCIFATSKNIPSLIVSGDFLSDFFFLISKFSISLPPLRERRDEIALMVNYMIPRFNEEYSKSVAGIESDGIKLLIACDWPLNMMGLISTVSQIVASSKTYRISASEIKMALSKQSTYVSPDMDITEGKLEDIEKKIIEMVLKKEGMNQSAAAKRLGIGRSTLRRKLGL